MTKPEQYYDLHIRIPLSKVATVIEVLNGEGKLVTVTEVLEPKPRKKPVRQAIFNGAERGIDLLARMVESVGKGNRVYLQDLEKAFKEEGRNPRSVSPLISMMLATKKLEKVGVGQYKVLIP